MIFAELIDMFAYKSNKPNFMCVRWKYNKFHGCLKASQLSTLTFSRHSLILLTECLCVFVNRGIGVFFNGAPLYLCIC